MFSRLPIFLKKVPSNFSNIFPDKDSLKKVILPDISPVIKDISPFKTFRKIATDNPCRPFFKNILQPSNTSSQSYLLLKHPLVV